MDTSKTLAPARLVEVENTMFKFKPFIKNRDMKAENLTELSDQELLQKVKNIKTNKIIDAVIIGATIGVVIYSAVKNGFGFFTFFPLLLAFLIARNSVNNKILERELQKELNSRNLE